MVDIRLSRVCDTATVISYAYLFLRLSPLPRNANFKVQPLYSRLQTTTYADWQIQRKLKITALQVAITAWLSGMLLVVEFRTMYYDISKGASCHTITQPPIYNHKGTKTCKPSKLLQNNYIRLLGKIPYYSPLYFL